MNESSTPFEYKELPDAAPGAPAKRKRPLANALYFLVFLCVCLVAVLCLLKFILPLKQQAHAIGLFAGQTSGRISGEAVGSVEGATQGVERGLEDGKTEGLSAKDTTAKIANSIETNVSSLGTLEVLAANVDLTTYHEDGKKYGALYLTRGSAVFTIDLSKVIVTYGEGRISIVLPQPTAEIKLDPTQTELLSDWQRQYFNGTDSEGFQAYLNSFRAIKNISETEVANYSALLDLASASAIRQVEEIANAARGNTNIAVTVSMQSK